MDRIRQIWIESARSNSYELNDCDPNTVEMSRPPPLRTSSTYDDDDVFTNVALNLLSRYEALDLSAAETVMATLISPKHRASFHDGLYVRLDRSSHLSPTTMTLVASLERVFGDALKRIVMSESKSGQPCYSTKPVTPRNKSSFFGGLPTSRKKKTTPRRFFPDSRKCKVQNIDWKLAEAIQQVESLRLDGMGSPRNNIVNAQSCYEPPKEARMP